MNSTTLASMLMELGTWIPTSPDIMEKAKTSGINTANNKKLKDLVKSWTNGLYDEDPGCLHRELVNLLKSK